MQFYCHLFNHFPFGIEVFLMFSDDKHFVHSYFAMFQIPSLEEIPKRVLLGQKV